MNYAIILSGGIGARMRSDGFPKQYIRILNKPILVYTLEVFNSHFDVDEIVIVAEEQWEQQIISWVKEYNLSKIVGIVRPGDTRQESIINGLVFCKRRSKSIEDRVIIHDAVRPLVSECLIKECFSQLDKYDGCMPVLPVKDTIYLSECGESITGLLNRDKLFAGQSPEAFKLWKYLEVNMNASSEEVIMTRGTSEIAFKKGMNIGLIKGDENNFKLTTPEDLRRFKEIMGDK